MYCDVSSFVSICWRDMGCWTQKHHPFGCLSDELLVTHCGISVGDHVPNVDILNRCNTSSVEFQLRSKRLRSLGHTLKFKMPNDRLPISEKLLFGQVKGTGPSERPRLSYNDVASSDCHECRITRRYKDAQNRLLCKANRAGKTIILPAIGEYLAHHELESVYYYYYYYYSRAGM